LIEADDKVLATIDEAFGAAKRPEHFTNYAHCCECAEHDELLRERTRETLKIEDVGNPGWDPLCFTFPDGIAYFFPTLARLALAEPTYDFGWYSNQLLFHLYSGFKENNFYKFCNEKQRVAVADLLAHIIESRSGLVEKYAATDDFLICHELWTTANQEDAPGQIATR
jgi:hypothetical protein